MFFFSSLLVLSRVRQSAEKITGLNITAIITNKLLHALFMNIGKAPPKHSIEAFALGFYWRLGLQESKMAGGITGICGPSS